MGTVFEAACEAAHTTRYILAVGLGFEPRDASTSLAFQTSALPLCHPSKVSETATG